MRRSLPQKVKRSARKPEVPMLSVYAGRLSLNEAPAVLDRVPTGEPVSGGRGDRGRRGDVKRAVIRE
jgi:hypothetical protein